MSISEHGQSTRSARYLPSEPQSHRGRTSRWKVQVPYGDQHEELGFVCREHAFEDFTSDLADAEETLQGDDPVNGSFPESCEKQTLLEMIKQREKNKREQLHLGFEVYEKRYQAQDFAGQMLADFASNATKA
ncbi:hypothetical protein pipiens_005999 [Culex pipiens pipiens]|uniref:Uncharacterized protein n=1 Tax=Culex pipiens pipiens TaxID=38569 RepID=A0ABD1DSB8_CULPP